MTVSIQNIDALAPNTVGVVRRAPGFPVEGEYVTVREEDGRFAAEGWWSINLGVDQRSDGRVDAIVVSPSRAVWRGEVSPSMVAPRLSDLATPEWFQTLAHYVHEAYASAKAAETARGRLHQKEEWVAGLVDDAHEWADENSLCSRFDDFMDSHDLPTRQRDYDVDVTITAQVTLSVRARDQASADEQVSREDIVDRLSELGVSGLSGLSFDWEVD